VPQDAYYSLVRYIADLARNEALNVGILLWNDADVKLRLDDEAIARIVRENPYLQTDALRHLEDELIDQLRVQPGMGAESALSMIDNQRGYLVAFTEPRLATVSDGSGPALDVAMDRLLERIVKPRRRTGGGRTPNPVEQLERQLRPLIRSRQVRTDHFFSKSLSGLPRRVNFFANSTANFALDVVKLTVKRADEISQRADAEAFKISDVLSGNPHVQFMVYCDVSHDPELQPTIDAAEKAIASIGAEVTTDINEARESMAAAVRRSREG
jgi:Protein of unknown function (DUF3037)